MPATLVLTNGRFYTLDPAQPTATAIALRHNRILAVGADEEMKALCAPGGSIIDLNGRCVTPGLVDAHVHFQNYALALQRVSLSGCATIDDALQRIAAHDQMNPAAANQWLLGRGWAQDSWPDRAFPTAAQLDQIIPDRPALLYHHSGHAAWVNSYALQRAGITGDTPNPPGGEIQRDANGEPTGILFEDGMNLVTEQIPRSTVTDVADAMRQAQAVCWQAGITGLHDFDGRLCFQALQSLHETGELGLRMVKNIRARYLHEAIGVGLRSGFGNEWLRIGGIKIFADGALGPRTAAMVEPYENDSGNSGIVVTDKEEMYAIASQASANGLSVTVHAIGDRANHDILDVYEAVRAEEANRPPAPLLRHRIEHVQILHPDDLHRLADLRVIASMQPIHATSDMETAVRHWGTRTRYSYAWRTMLSSGATLVFGSDAPIEPIEPLRGLHAAVTRRRADGTPGADGWHPEQKLTMVEAVHAFTQAAAYTSGQGRQLGSLTPGKLADLTIFDRDIFVIPADELLHVAIAGTMIDGVFRHQTW